MIFVAATLLGFASHSPGGLGVFDAAMLVALWQFDKEELLAGLLLFRLLYYIIPFALSLLILGARELMLALSALRAIVPRRRRWRSGDGDRAPGAVIDAKRADAATRRTGTAPRIDRSGGHDDASSRSASDTSCGSAGSSARGWCCRSSPSRSACCG